MTPPASRSLSSRSPPQKGQGGLTSPAINILGVASAPLEVERAAIESAAIEQILSASMVLLAHNAISQALAAGEIDYDWADGLRD